MAHTAGQKLRDRRIAQAISQSELARRAKLSRQALGAIESGTYLPGVEVALRLAAALGTTVEQLFGQPEGGAVVAQYAGVAARGLNTRVGLARVRGRLIAVPLPATGVTLTPAGGLVARCLPKRRVEVAPFRSRAEMELTLVVAGCDPGVAIVRDYLARQKPAIELAVLPASSHDALAAVSGGNAHAAGVHLRDPQSDGYNLAAARAALSRTRFRVVQFARWEVGLASRVDAPVKSLDELAARNLRIVNRKVGSGARAVLDELLAASAVSREKILGYERCVAGHLEVAAAIAAGMADAGVTIRLAAALHGLHFESWREERYDLIIPEDEVASAAVAGLLNALNSGALANEISQLCLYDTSRMGATVG